MIKTEKVICCDICGNKMTMDDYDDFYDYGWNEIVHGGRRYHLCPEHSTIYFNITSEFDEKLNNFFEGVVKAIDQ